MSLAGLFLAVILFLSLNVLSGNTLRSARLDLTQEGLFTLSQGSMRIVRAIPEPIRLRFYFSEKLANQLPAVKTYGLRVRELLEEYVNRSDGRIRLEVIDPEPFSDAEEAAVRVGLQAVPLGAGDNLYFGLVGTNTIDDRQVVPFFSRDKEQFLEYDLTRLIHNLSDPKKPVVGLLTGHQMNADVSPLMRFGGGPQPWAIVDYIRDVFDLKALDPRDLALDDGIDILLIVHPKGLDERALYAIDQFVLRGGRAVVYVDPYSEIEARGRQQRQRQRMMGGGDAASGLEKLLNAWGVSVSPDIVVGDFEAAQQVNAGQAGRTRIVRYLVWLRLAGERLNRDDVVTADLGPVIVANAGVVDRLEDGKTEVTPLITSSPQSMRMEAELVRYGPAPERLLQIFKPGDVSQMIAARIAGEVSSAFPDGPPKVKADKDAADDKAEGKTAETPVAPHLQRSQRPIGVIVVADTDLLHDQFWLRRQNLMGQDLIVPIAANADFLVNALDNLAGSNDLIGLRSRGKSERPFVAVEKLRRAAERKFLAEERALKEKLEATKSRIAELESKAKAGGGALLTAEQQSSIQEARQQILKTRRELRGVQHNLNRDIERLETRLKFANIGLMPIAIAVIAVIIALLRHRRRRRRAETELS
jgi:ABC-type uncharacterized transport system involved in gliding motility auxiliary subunit